VLRERIEARLGLQAATVVEIEEGWDSRVLEVNGEWIVRVPRREEVREWMRREARLLPELAAVLPVPIPRFEVVEDSDVFFVAYRKLRGEPLVDVEAPVPLAGELGRFLATLHVLGRGHEAATWLAQHWKLIDRCIEEVAPLLASDEARRAEAMFSGVLSSWDESLPTALIHADLGPAHILHDGRSVTGVIDWSDARLGDPALDFAWLLHGTSDAFATSLFDTYTRERSPDPGLGDRALFYHRLGPWHGVLYGLEHGRTDLIESGLAGIRERLPE
jgi:aminoglycoside phosphotransferase (APT) family kinase protein